MKTLMKVVMCAHLMATPALSHAASLEGFSREATVRAGAFAGARLRLKLGGKGDHRARIGLTVAPLRAAQGDDGARALRIGEGLELGFKSSGATRLMIGGQPIDRRFGAADDKGGGGVPTWVLITGGIVIVAGIGAAVFIDRLEDASD